jgi:hypothetical protein
VYFGGSFHCTQTLQTQEIDTVARFTGGYPWGEPDRQGGGCSDAARVPP